MLSKYITDLKGEIHNARIVGNFNTLPSAIDRLSNSPEKALFTHLCAEAVTHEIQNVLRFGEEHFI